MSRVESTTPRAQPPSHRPPWLLALASAMLLYAGVTLVGGLFVLKDPKGAARRVAAAVRDRSERPPLSIEATQQLAAIDDAILERHRWGVRANALAAIGVGLYTLYAVAAIFSRDRHGRALALGVALFGIVHQVGVLPLDMRMAREAVVERSPELAAALGTADRPPAELAREVQVRFLGSTVVALFWCVLITVYFGGRRGRTLYGLLPPK